MTEAYLRQLEHFTGKSRLQLAMEDMLQAPVRNSLIGPKLPRAQELQRALERRD